MNSEDLQKLIQKAERSETPYKRQQTIPILEIEKCSSSVPSDHGEAKRRLSGVSSFAPRPDSQTILEVNGEEDCSIMHGATADDIFDSDGKIVG